MDYEIVQKWPFNDYCIAHVNKEDNELVMRGRKILWIYFYKNIYSSTKSG
jgi:hypothetical protein